MSPRRPSEHDALGAARTEAMAGCRQAPGPESGRGVSRAIERAATRARAAWASDRVRLAVLTLYYLAILIGVVWVRGQHLAPTRFVYQEF